MNAFSRVTMVSAAALALLALSPHLRRAHGQEVAPPPRAAEPGETVELEVPPGMPLVMEVGPSSRQVAHDAGVTRIEGDATITLGKEVVSKNGDPQETLRRMRAMRRGDALRLHIRHSRVTVETGQPNYPSHVFIEPLPAPNGSKG